MARVSAADLIAGTPQTTDDAETSSPAAGPTPRKTRKTSTPKTTPATPAKSRTRKKPAGEKASGGETKPAAPAKSSTQDSVPAKTTPTPRRAPGPGATMPDEPDGIPGEKRINLPLWEGLWRKLGAARLDDGVDTTIRVRAMIELWDHDPTLRKRIDKLAKSRAASVHRGRPRTRD